MSGFMGKIYGSIIDGLWIRDLKQVYNPFLEVNR